MTRGHGDLSSHHSDLPEESHGHLSPDLTPVAKRARAPRANWSTPGDRDERGTRTPRRAGAGPVPADTSQDRTQTDGDASPCRGPRPNPRKGVPSCSRQGSVKEGRAGPLSSSRAKPTRATRPRPARLRSALFRSRGQRLGVLVDPLGLPPNVSRALERADRQPAHYACRSNLPPVGHTSPPQQAGGSSAGVTQLLGLCLGHRHHMSLLGDFRMREVRIKAATRWSPTTATNIRHKRLGTSFRVSGTSSEGGVESHQDVPHQPGRPASHHPPPRPEGHEQPPLCPEALESPAGTQGRSRTACKTETTKGGHARKRNNHRSDSTLSLPGKGRSRQERL
ncbi:uncharacterized protein LOC124973209 [Sciurus carolinensis]|uniref:uncharacterized protein LOC124973209 n=1 Tax=Sciurus carolinensis TaxID=30640 RepID=UPI001FB20837|nr:uncharacterized protein LOC124973209 [Sciurus carolinensis]